MRLLFLAALVSQAVAANFTACGRTFSPEAAPLTQLSGNISMTSSGSPADVQSVRDVLARYPFIIDSKTFDSLDQVFTDDAVGSFVGGIGVVQPLSAIKSSLRSSLANVDSQIMYGTQFISVVDAGCGLAVASTYYNTNHLGRGLTSGQAAYSYGTFQDVLLKTPRGWRIRQRVQRPIGPLFVGNPLIFV